MSNKKELQDFLDEMHQKYLDNRQGDETEDEYYKRRITQHKKNIQTLDNQIYEAKKKMYGNNFKNDM